MDFNTVYLAVVQRNPDKDYVACYRIARREFRKILNFIEQDDQT